MRTTAANRGCTDEPGVLDPYGGLKEYTATAGWGRLVRRPPAQSRLTSVEGSRGGAGQAASRTRVCGEALPSDRLSVEAMDRPVTVGLSGPQDR
jgi:hypothetical protein